MPGPFRKGVPEYTPEYTDFHLPFSPCPFAGAATPQNSPLIAAYGVWIVIVFFPDQSSSRRFSEHVYSSCRREKSFRAPVLRASSPGNPTPTILLAARDSEHGCTSCRPNKKVSQRVASFRVSLRSPNIVSPTRKRAGLPRRLDDTRFFYAVKCKTDLTDMPTYSARKKTSSVRRRRSSKKRLTAISSRRRAAHQKGGAVSPGRKRDFARCAAQNSAVRTKHGLTDVSYSGRMNHSEIEGLLEYLPAKNKASVSDLLSSETQKLISRVLCRWIRPSELRKLVEASFAGRELSYYRLSAKLTYGDEGTTDKQARAAYAAFVGPRGKHFNDATRNHNLLYIWLQDSVKNSRHLHIFSAVTEKGGADGAAQRANAAWVDLRERARMNGIVGSEIVSKPMNPHATPFVPPKKTLNPNAVPYMPLSERGTKKTSRSQ